MALAIPQQVPWYLAPLRLLRGVFQVRRFPGVALIIRLSPGDSRSFRGVGCAPRPDQR
jgi:hypothetical protein